MIFDFFTAFSAGLIALIFAAAFLVWLEGRDCSCKRTSKALGYAVLAASFAALTCIAYQGWRYSKAGAFQPPRKGPNVHMQMDGMNVGPAMNPGMMNPMMQQQMRQRAQQKTPPLPNSGWEDMPAPPPAPPPPAVLVPDAEPPSPSVPIPGTIPPVREE